MILKSILIVIAAFLPMCSSRSSETNQSQQNEKAEPAPAVAEKAPAVNVEWAKEIDELIEKTAGLAALADTAKCSESHDALVNYLKTHQSRLEELAMNFRKMEKAVPLEDKATFQKKVSTDYEPSVGMSIETMAKFAQLCCNNSLTQDQALGLEAKLQFIRTLKSAP